MQGINIKLLPKIGENDNGSTFSFDTLGRTGELVYGYRKEGSISGRHYHEGKSAQKDPEVFIILRGEVEFYARTLQNGEEMRSNITQPSLIEISPYIWHEVKAITDFVFLELNTMTQHIADTKYKTEDIDINKLS